MFFSPLEQFDVKPIIFFNIGNYDLTLFHIFIPLILIILIIFGIFLLKLYFKLIPYSIQSVCEHLIEFIFSIVKNQIGKDGYLLLPFILTLFLFVICANLLSIVPFGIALTSHLIITMWLSLSVCSGVFFFGIFLKNLNFLKIFVPTCPLALLPVLIIIELFSYVIRAFSLSIRLTANILAGHTLVNIISLFILNTLVINWLFSFLGFLSIFAVLLLEIGVACLQAYVLTILVCIYLNDVFSEIKH